MIIEKVPGIVVTWSTGAVSCSTINENFSFFYIWKLLPRCNRNWLSLHSSWHYKYPVLKLRNYNAVPKSWHSAQHTENFKKIMIKLRFIIFLLVFISSSSSVVFEEKRCYPSLRLFGWRDFSVDKIEFRPLF